MAVNQKLAQEIGRRLDVTPRHVNRLIDQTATRSHLPREIAALSLGSTLSIPVHRYASPDQLAQLRGAPPIPSVVVIDAPTAKRVAAKAAPKPTRNNSIFVVHGRDEQLTDDMYSFLRAIGLNPIEWNDAVNAAKGGANPIVGDIINQAMKKAQGIMVLLSPDEDAKLKSKFAGFKDKKIGLNILGGQPRPNVIFEAGLALGAHSDKTILVQVGDIREISDIAGKHMFHLTDTAVSRKNLAGRLEKKLKFKIKLDGDAWLKVGKFNR